MEKQIAGIRSYYCLYYDLIRKYLQRLFDSHLSIDRSINLLGMLLRSYKQQQIKSGHDKHLVMIFFDIEYFEIFTYLEHTHLKEQNYDQSLDT
jgi:hypothetical protein